MADVGARYSRRYSARQAPHLYPVEFVVRAFLGSYPGLTMDKASYRGSAILDLGCGDGRNLLLLSDLGFVTHAVEIADPICQLVLAHVERLGLGTLVRKGSNSNIPFPDGFFDYVLACHSLYYVEVGETFQNNVNELARVVRRGGTVLASLAKKYGGYTQRGADLLPDNHIVVRNDPLGLRNGVVFKVFDDEPEIVREFEKYFGAFQIGWIDNDFFGVEERLWIVKMTRS